MEKVDLVVVHTPVGGGHKAAALAVVEAARAKGMKVALVDTFEHAPRAFGRAYLAAHLAGQGFAPKLYGSMYTAADHRGGAFEPIRRNWDHVAFLGLLKHVCALDPRVVVATHHLPLVVLGRARRRGWLDAPLVGVVTDYTGHAVWAEKGVDALCVPCPRARHELMLHGVRPDRLSLTGIPVRAAFESMPAVREPAKGERLRVLVTSGGFGVGPVAKVVRSFASMDDVELTVVCGRAETLVTRVEAIASREGMRDRVRVIGFERDMATRVREAHVVVGKAGGLTVSETMAAGRPMTIVGTVPGNESINEAMVVDAGAGVACAPDDVARRVIALRGSIEAMGARARALVPQGAADAVVGSAQSMSWVARSRDHAA
jgi:processive 1,2-diacylglycerol beta-glucosyltransferase